MAPATQATQGTQGGSPPSSSLTGAPPLVRVRGAVKTFGSTRALDHVDLDLHESSVLALLGQNGAGKSTLIKVLAQVHSLDEGEASIAGAPLGTPEASRAIAFIHQDLGLVDGLSVAENVALGSGYPRRAGRLIGWREVQRRAREALEVVGCDVSPRARVAELSRSEKSLVAIGRALVVKAKVLVLDEPTASLPVDETERLFTVLRRLRDEGMGLLYVSHRLDEVFALADQVTVMRDGRVVSTGRVADTTPEKVVQEIVGRTPVPPPPPVARTASEPALELDGLVGQRVGPVSFEVRKGEVVGLVGLAGAGHMEVGRTVVGDQPAYAGSMRLHGRPHAPRSVAAAVEAGVGFVTSNRAEEGLAMALTLTENFRPNLALSGAGRFGFRRHRAEHEDAQRLVTTYGVRPPNADLPASALSGGNQQKVILGRWLSTDAGLLVLEEPTAGVDVGAKHELYTLLDDSLAQGLAVLLISTDFEEVASVCHRAIVFKDGRIVRSIPREELDVATLVQYASGAAA